jgi:ATP-binding cassette subfamily B protein
MKGRGFPESVPGVSAPEKTLREQLKVMRRLVPLIWPKGKTALKIRVCIAFGLMLAAKLFNILVPYFYKRAVDHLSDHAGVIMLVPVALIVFYGTARVLAQASDEFQDWIFARVAQRAVRQIALDVLSHLHALSLGFHFDRQTGSLNRALERGSSGIESLMSFMLFNITPIILEILLTAAVLWHFYDADFAIITFITIAVYVVWTSWMTHLRVGYRREMNAADNEASSRSLDSLLNYETVKYFGNEAHELARYDEAKLSYFKAALRSQRSLSLLNLGQGLVITTGVVLVMLLAGQGVAAGRMGIGDFVLVNAYLLQLYVPLGNLGSLYRNMRQSLTDVETVFTLLERQPELQDRPNAIPLREGPGHIVFDTVTFGYDARRIVIRDISFAVPAGHTVAVVGPTGSGKTTISRLLFRFYDPAQGSVTIDGQDLRDVTQDSLRRAVGVVPQDTVLFNETIYYNIAYGRTDATRAEVEEAARLAKLDRFIAQLPDGYQTRVGERGLKLSGGEKQRVAIARVILKNPRILIFDEATSALDTRTEREIQASLAQISSHRTTVVITHRLTTVENADTILVLDQGHIAEHGTHSELLKRKGLYATMWSRQKNEEEKTPESSLC